MKREKKTRDEGIGRKGETGGINGRLTEVIKVPQGKGMTWSEYCCGIRGGMKCKRRQRNKVGMDEVRK